MCLHMHHIHGNWKKKKKKKYAVIVWYFKCISKNSDYIYLTSDNPQFESVRDICSEIAKYIKDKDKFEIIENRKEAITKAIMNADEGDIVVLLAKGGEKYIQINNVNVEYEGDMEIAKEVLKLKNNNSKKLIYN